MEVKREGLLICGVPDTQAFYVGISGIGGDGRVEGVEAVGSFLQALNVGLLRRGVTYKDVPVSAVLAIERIRESIIRR